MTITKKHFAGAVLGAVLASAAILPVAAQTTNVSVTAAVGTPPQTQNVRGTYRANMKMGDRSAAMRPGIAGTVNAVNGTTLTVTGRAFTKDAATTTYSVNAASATVRKDNATSTVSSILANDHVFVQGTISGTNVTATSITDGKLGMRGAMGKGFGTSTPLGNGQPVVAGAVSAINGNSITITTKSNTQYVIDASASKVTKNGSTSTLSGIVVGDEVVVQGAVNGSNVTASLIIDGRSGRNAGTPGQNQGQGQNGQPAPRQGVFGSISGFFKHLFGF